VEKVEVSKSEIAKAYGKPLSTQSAYLKYRVSAEQQASQGRNILKHNKICGTKHDNGRRDVLIVLPCLEEQTCSWWTKSESEG
jgi:hypothetical protein